MAKRRSSVRRSSCRCNRAGGATAHASGRQAIVTKYLGPTDSRGARIQAKSESGKSVSIPYPYELSTSAGHALAAKTLADKLGWGGNWVGGGIKGGYVFVDVG